MKQKKVNYLAPRVALFLILAMIVTLFLLAGILILDPQKHSRLALVCTAAYVLLFGWFFFSIMRPYLALRKNMILFVSGHTYDAISHLDAYISPSERLVICRLSELADHGPLSDSSQKQAEYLALQNQINPHFLYNTLESIRGEALVAGLDELADMTEAMARFFRYSISKTSSLVRLEDELLNIENYFRIQRYRFGAKLDFRIEMDKEDSERLYNCFLPKMTLQPIVENAVYHGIEPKLGNGLLRIRAEVIDDMLSITISDDGVGIGQDRLDALNDKLNRMSMQAAPSGSSSGNGIALLNVNTRIKLLFGEAYGLHVYSFPNAGTDVVVTLPLKASNTTAGES